MKKEIQKTQTPQIFWELEVKDKNGKVISKKQVPAKSWLVAFITILKSVVAARKGVGAGNASVVNEAGASKTLPGCGYSYEVGSTFFCLAAAADVTRGIIVGSGDTPNTITTYKLNTKIPHGSTSGLLLYGIETVEDVTNPSGSDLQFRITRAFTNNSGATITVKEIGLLTLTADSADAPWSFLIARDVLPSPSDVPDGATLTIRYIVKITVA